MSPNPKRYIRVWKEDVHHGQDKGVSRSVYCFVDTTTGNILNGSNWKRPAKGARSNIFDPDHGISGVTEYGGRYFR